MTHFVGVDGCLGGWLAIGLDREGRHSSAVEPSIRGVVERFPKAELILVDIPIGLRESGTAERACDLLARRAIGPRRSSVFPAPCRQALTAQNYTAGSEINGAVLSRKLSKQAWAIVPKIRDVDDFLATRDSRTPRIREIHPELCFWALNGGHTLSEPKHTEDGLRLRTEILSRYVANTESIVAGVLEQHPRGRIGADDILDALSAAVTAQGPLQTLPATPEVDARGLRMEMVYRAPQPMEVPAAPGRRSGKRGRNQ